jgi:hypothetical protein
VNMRRGSRILRWPDGDQSDTCVTKLGIPWHCRVISGTVLSPLCHMSMLDICVGEL